MDAIDFFLRDHAGVHTRAVAPDPNFNIDVILDDMTDAQLRARPAGLNSVAWILWHMARVEDACLALCVFAGPQVLDVGGWMPRLRVPRRDAGTGMSRAEVDELSARVDLGALRGYRDEVGRRTRVAVRDLWPERWSEPVTADDERRTQAAGVRIAPVAGTPREALVFWWGIYHNFWHMGQCTMIKGRLRETGGGAGPDAARPAP